MYQIQPVRSRKLQKELAEKLGTEFVPHTYAMFAGELADDYATVTELIAMCQFTFGEKEAEIMSVGIAEGHEEDEAVTVLIRAMMSLVNNAEIPVVSITGAVLSPDRIKKLGFRQVPGQTDKWAIDLEEFYKAPCAYTAGQKQEQ
ncbi:MAG: hypothetical protein IJU57_07530 [Clostridia bacterium]|nr:hypothetical protein [Clostridia bacterium]